MSRYKDQIKDHFSEKELKAGTVLSIGGQEDDRSYFGNFVCDELVVMDVDPQNKPDIIFDMNQPLESLFDTGTEGLELNERFDVVIALNLWEYIYDPLTALKNVTDMLKPGGRLIANFPFVYPLHNPPSMDYLRYTPEGVEKLMAKAGLTLREHEFIVGNTLLKAYYQADGLKARAGFDHLVIGSIVEATKG